jgi:hypothetical protein
LTATLAPIARAEVESDLAPVFNDAAVATWCLTAVRRCIATNLREQIRPWDSPNPNFQMVKTEASHSLAPGQPKTMASSCHLLGLTLLAFFLAPPASSSTVPVATPAPVLDANVVFRPVLRKTWSLEEEVEDPKAQQREFLVSELAESRGLGSDSEIARKIHSALGHTASASAADSQAKVRMDEGTHDESLVPDGRGDITKMTKDKLKPAEPRPQTIGRVFEAVRRAKQLGDLRPDRLLISIGWKARQTVTDIQNFIRKSPYCSLPFSPFMLAKKKIRNHMLCVRSVCFFPLIRRRRCSCIAVDHMGLVVEKGLFVVMAACHLPFMYQWVRGEEQPEPEKFDGDILTEGGGAPGKLRAAADVLQS